MGNHESAAMWKIYGAPGPGIAITTTADRLKLAFAANPESIGLRLVNYIDPIRESVDTENGFNVVLTKRNNYSYEAEVRLVYWNTALNEGMPHVTWNGLWGRFIIPHDEMDEFEQRPVPPGHPFPILIDALIGDIWISPYSPPWYAETVSRLCQLSGIDREPKRSTLLNPPVR
jgi:hypothetical protein